jgi:hypothetical protein
MRMRNLFWMFGLTNPDQCPYCKSQLLKHYDEGAFSEIEVWRCPKDGCEFNADK